MTGPRSDRQKLLDKAHWFSSGLVLESRSLETAAEDLLKRIYKHAKPEREQRTKHLLQLKVLILNFVKTSKTDERCMSLSFAAGNYAGEISYRVLVERLVKPLISMGWLRLYKGYHLKGSSSNSRISRVGLNRPLLEWLAELAIDPDDIDYKAPQSCLVLKDTAKKNIKVPAEMKERALELEASTHRINANLDRTFINLFIDEYELEDLNELMSAKANEEPLNQFKFDPTNRYLTRIFNNNSLEQGGRFYGAWWQSIPKEYRTLISLNGEYTVEMDYSCVHIHLLYAELQQACSMEDHYVFGKLTREFRPITKKVMMILINAKTEKSALGAIKKQGLFNGGYPEGVNSTEEFLEEIHLHHHPIKKYFSSGMGVKLQYKDSQIAEGVMLEMLPESCLPVHDSFIVKETLKERLEEVMNEQFELTTGFKAGIKATVLKLTEDKKAVVNKIINDELSSYSKSLSTWRKKYNWKYFTKGGFNTDEPLKVL